MEQLPEEMLTEIFSYLHYETILNVRLVCKKFYKATCNFKIGDRFKILLNDQVKIYKIPIYNAIIEKTDFLTNPYSDLTNLYTNLRSVTIYNQNINIKDFIKQFNEYQNLTSIFFEGCTINNRNAKLPNIPFRAGKHVKIIGFKNCKIDVKFLERFYEDTNIRNFDEFIFNYSVITSENPSHLDTQPLLDLLMKNERLKILELDIMNNMKLPHLNIFPQLTTLVVSFFSKNHNINDIWKWAQNFKTLKNLEIINYGSGFSNVLNVLKLELDLRHLRLPDIDPMNYRITLPKLNNLRCLILENIGSMDLSLFETVKEIQLQNLRELTLNNCHFFRKDCFPYLIHIFPSITKLDVTSTNFTNNMLETVVKNWKNLKILILKQTDIPTYYAEHLTGQLLSQLETLEHISLSRTVFTDRVCDHLKLSRLLTIELFENITAEGLVCLANGCPNLEVIRPGIYHNVDREALDLLLRIFKKILSGQLFTFQDYKKIISRYTGCPPSRHLWTS